MSNILPDKTIKISYSLLGIGAMLVKKVSNRETVSSLWEKVKNEKEVNSFEKYIRGLIFLYSIGAISFNGGIISVGSIDENN